MLVVNDWWSWSGTDGDCEWLYANGLSVGAGGTGVHERLGGADIAGWAPKYVPRAARGIFAARDRKLEWKRRLISLVWRCKALCKYEFSLDSAAHMRWSWSTWQARATGVDYEVLSSSCLVPDFA